MKSKTLLTIALICVIQSSCGNSEVSYTDVEFDKKTETILYKGKPYTGKVLGDDAHSNEYAVIKDGKLIDIIKTEQMSNGYKRIIHQDKSSEYYDYNGNRISKSEYDNNN